MTGVKAGRFDEAQQKYLNVKNQYPNADIITTGHSLGGSQALYVARKNNLSSYIFNTGSSPLDIKDELFIGSNSKIKAFHTPGDIISTSNRYLDKSDKVINVPVKDFTKIITGVAAAGYLNLGLGIVSGVGASLFKFHDLANFLPDKLIKQTKSNYLIREKAEIPINTSKSMANFGSKPAFCPPYDINCYNKNFRLSSAS